MSAEPLDDKPAEGRVTLLLASPRSAPGLLSWAAWERLRNADAVLGADVDPGWEQAFAAADVVVQDLTGVSVGERAGRLVQAAADSGSDLVWWGSPDGDPGLTDALAQHLAARAAAGPPPQIEVLTGAYDVPGARVLDLITVMDTLRSPGGCPWDAEQTHESLLPYLLEETHEVIEAVEGGDREHLVEELGDLLLQVVFHARLGMEDVDRPFDVDEVAAGIVAKLVRRHPHVFGAGDDDNHDGDEDGEERPTAGDVEQNWEQLKAAEKPRRTAFEGIPASLPSLARAQKMLGRLERVGEAHDVDQAIATAADGDELVAVLLGAVRTARAQDVDAEARLRAALGRLPAP